MKVQERCPEGHLTKRGPNPISLHLPRGVGGTLTFAYYRGSDYLFGFKILNFAIFWVSRFCQLFLWVCQQVFFWVSFSAGIVLGCQFKIVYFVVFLVYKVHYFFFVYAL